MSKLELGQNSNCKKKRKNSNCDKIPVVTILKCGPNSNMDRTQIVKNTNCDKTQIATKL